MVQCLQVGIAGFLRPAVSLSIEDVDEKLQAWHQNGENQSRLHPFQSKMSMLPARIQLSRVNAWRRRTAALVIPAALLLAGCNILFPSTGISDTGYPVVISRQAQAIYADFHCKGLVVATIQAGENLVDLGPANSTCEQVAYPTGDGYTQYGYVPVSSISRATHAVRCANRAGCYLRAGPDATAAILAILSCGQRAPGRDTTITGAIITDGANYSWWEVIVPSTGQVADMYGPLAVAF